MSRLEAAVRSPLAFRRGISDGTASLADPPETARIVFDGRLFVWHSFADGPDDPIFGDRDVGPSVTSVLGGASYAEVATELERFLSALSFHHQQPAEVLHYGSSWETDPFKLPFTRAPRAAGRVLVEPCKSISLRRDSEALLKALAWHREGQNAGSPFYRFLAYWNSLEATFGDAKRRDAFVDTETPQLSTAWGESYPLPKAPAEAFREASRNAIAHVVRLPGKPVIDPDADTDRQRLETESRFLNWLVRAAIQQEFGEPVSIS